MIRHCKVVALCSCSTQKGEMGTSRNEGKTLVRPGNAAVTGQRGYRTLAHKVPALFSTSITSISLRRAVSTDCAEREGSLSKQGRDVYAGDELREPPPTFLGPLFTLQGRSTLEQRKRRAPGAEGEDASGEGEEGGVRRGLVELARDPFDRCAARWTESGHRRGGRSHSHLATRLLASVGALERSARAAC